MKLEWTTGQRKVNDLIPSDFNPRKISEAQRMKLVESLQKFNLVDIPVINHDGSIISGHQRIFALQAIGRGDELIDVRSPNRMLTDKELKEYMLIANSHAGEWNKEVFEEFFADVDIADIGFGLEDDIFAAFEEEEEDEQHLEAKEDDYEPEDNLKVDVVKGDLIEFRKGDIYHRLLCGDSTNADDVEKVMDSMEADLYLTDPPYGVSYASKNEYLNTIARGNRIQVEIENDHKTPEEMYELWCQWFSLACGVLKQKSSYYIFSPQGGDLLLLLQAVRDSGFQLKHVLVWAKNNHVLGRCDYNYKHEPIVYGWKQKGTHVFYGNGIFKTSVWEFNKPLKNDLHPTMKPVELLSNAVLNSTQKGDLIFDNFLGSGSTMVAAHQLARNCYGLELTEHYCQVIINRMAKLDPEIEITINGKPYKPQI